MDIQVDQDYRPSSTYSDPSHRPPSHPLAGTTCNPRDLVTPPVMAQPRSPPPLPAPRFQDDTVVAIAGSVASDPDRAKGRLSPPSPLAASPPQQPRTSHWPCSGEADSPMELYSTRVLFTSTAPDASPSA
jgi:hypothetical protein